MYIRRWGLMRRLHRGNKLMLFLTYRCNLSCSYCSLKYAGERVKSKEIGLEDWKHLIRNFPVKLREIRISGGEPMLVPYFAELVNWLVDRGLYVLVFTNFTIINTKIKPSHRLIFDTTYHKRVSKKIWQNVFEYYKKKFRINAYQLETETIKGIKVRPVCHSEYGYTCVGFMYNPAGKLSVGFMDMLEGK